MKEIKIIMLPTISRPSRREVVYTPPVDNPRGWWKKHTVDLGVVYIHPRQVGKEILSKIKDGRQGTYPVVIFVGNRKVFSNI